MVVVAMQGTAMFRAVTSPRESEVTLQENHNYPIMKGAFVAMQLSAICEEEQIQRC